MTFVISIDVGFYHLGIIGANIHDIHNNNITIKFIGLINIQELCHECLLNEEYECGLCHDNCIADYMSHFFLKFDHELSKANFILIEQQPPSGLIAVQELLRFKYRNKVKMISPVKMHSFFNISKLDYEERKQFTIKKASPFLRQSKMYRDCLRKHDIADAFCMILFFFKITL